MGEFEITNLGLSFPSGYGEEVKDNGTHLSAGMGSGLQGRHLLVLFSHHSKYIDPSFFLSCLPNLAHMDRPLSLAYLKSNHFKILPLETSIFM